MTDKPPIMVRCHNMECRAWFETTDTKRKYCKSYSCYLSRQRQYWHAHKGPEGKPEFLCRNCRKRTPRTYTYQIYCKRPACVQERKNIANERAREAE